MGTSFVTITEGNSGSETGFWMNDSMLELWLRLLALHLPEPASDENDAEIREIRDRWLLASRGYFNGCVPHDMEYACETESRRNIVRHAIESLIKRLNAAPEILDSGVINLLNGGCEFVNIERELLCDIGNAFNDLISGKITETASSTDIMPGSKPYTPADA